MGPVFMVPVFVSINLAKFQYGLAPRQIKHLLRNQMIVKDTIGMTNSIRHIKR